MGNIIKYYNNNVVKILDENYIQNRIILYPLP